LDNPSKRSFFTGNTLADVMQSLDSQEYWKLPKKSNSLFRLFAKGLQPTDLEDSTQKYLSRVSGTTGGKKNSLSWSIKIKNMSNEFIQSLV
jgi:hypothetical protein